MSQGSIQVRISELRQASDTIRSGATNVDNAITSVDREMNQVGADRYSSDAATNFRTQYQNARRRLMEAREVLNAFSRDLIEAADIIENANR